MGNSIKLIAHYQLSCRAYKVSILNRGERYINQGLRFFDRPSIKGKV